MTTNQNSGLSDSEINSKESKESIGDIAKKDHNRIDPENDKEYSLYSFSAYDDKQKPVIEKGKEINSAKYRVPDHSILISKLNPRINRVWRIDEAGKNAICSTEFIVLRPREGVPLDYLYAVLNEPSFRSYLTKLTTGTSGSHQRVKQTDILEYEVIEFEGHEKNIIADIYGSLEKKMSVNMDIAQCLSRIAQAVFESWFIDFKPYDNFESSKYGKIPKSFELGTLGELMEKKTEAVDPEKMSSSSPYISLKHMPKKSIILDKWGDAGDIASRKYQFKTGDILFGKLRPYFCKVGPAQVDGLCSTDILVITPKQDDVWKEFILFQLTHSSFIDYCDKVSTGTRMPRVSWKDMCEYEIPIPSRKAVEEFHEYVRPLLGMISSNISESNSLEQIRDILLPKLMSGEIRVNDIDLDELEVGSEV